MATTEGTAAVGALSAMLGCVWPVGATSMVLPMGLLPTTDVALMLVLGWVLLLPGGQLPPKLGYTC